MITFHKYEGKNLETIKEQCLSDLNVVEEDLYLIESEKENGLFKGKKIIVEAITKEEIIAAIKEFFKELSRNMAISVNVEVRIENENINVLVLTDNNNIMIGKDGRTLNSIQLILRQAMRDLNKFGLKIIVDIGNYKSKRLKNLEYEIKKICKEVLKTKVEVKLDPMNSYERRKVHSIVGEFADLQSISYGIDPQRYTVIKFKD